MASTTLEVSAATRDRIRAHGGVTHEETTVAALDALEDTELWMQAERAKAWLDADPDVKAEIDADVAESDVSVAAIR